LEKLKLVSEALKTIQQLKVCQSGSDGDICLPSWCMSDIMDHLEEFATHGRGCQPVCIRDLGDLPHTGAVPLELTQDRLSHPGREALKRKRLIHLHGTPL
jgi:hypothetical protein